MLGASLQTYCEEKGEHEFSRDCNTRFGQKILNVILPFKKNPLSDTVRERRYYIQHKTLKNKLM